MSKQEKDYILKNTVSLLAIEGMFVTKEEKQKLSDCLDKKMSFDDYRKEIIAQYAK